jgi:glycosyltransferase involved in cell wall biosynthesis
VNPPLVSIIIPCFNAQRFVETAVQSALDQTYSPVEIVAVDDASRDGTLDVLRRFDDKVRILSVPHEGGAAARNHGLRIAKGEFIQFLDADDLLHPGKITRQMDAQRLNPSDVNFCDGVEISGTDETVLRRFNSRYDGGDPLLFVLRNEMQTSAPLHRRESLMKVGGFREELPCAQERDLHVRLACSGATFHQTPETLYTKRRFPGSVSSRYERVLEELNNILVPAFDNLSDRGAMTESRARAFAEFMMRCARHALRRNMTALALRYVAEAKRMHSGGGLTAYGPTYRWAFRLLGPVRAERLASTRNKA